MEDLRKMTEAQKAADPRYVLNPRTNRNNLRPEVKAERARQRAKNIPDTVKQLYKDNARKSKQCAKEQGYSSSWVKGLFDNNGNCIGVEAKGQRATIDPLTGKVYNISKGKPVEVTVGNLFGNNIKGEKKNRKGIYTKSLNIDGRTAKLTLKLDTGETRDKETGEWKPVNRAIARKRSDIQRAWTNYVREFRDKGMSYKEAIRAAADSGWKGFSREQKLQYA